MAFKVAYVDLKSLPTPFVVAMTYNMSQSGPARSDVNVTMPSSYKNADGTFSILVTVTGNYNPKPPATGTPIDTNVTLITTPGANGLGFDVRSGSSWPGVTNKISSFMMTFDAATLWPTNFQVQVGAANNTPPGTPNTVYVFSKSGIGG